MSDELANILAQWQQWPLSTVDGKAPALLGELGGGLTNRSFLLGDGEQQWVLRINDRNPPAAANPRGEAIIQARVAERGLSPALLYQHDSYTYSVRPFVPATTLSSLLPATIEPQRLETLCDLIARYQPLFDASDETTIGSYDYRALLQSYANDAQRSTRDFDAMIALAGEIDQDARHTGLVLSHHDLTPGNILLDIVHPPCPPVMLIDWEFAKLGHRAMDFAMLAVELAINPVDMAAIARLDDAAVTACMQLYRYVTQLYPQTRAQPR